MQNIDCFFDDIIADMLKKNKLNPVVTTFIIRSRKLKISLVFITQLYFAVPKNIRIVSTHYFIIKVPFIRELQETAFNHSPNIDFQNFENLYKKFTAKPYSFLVIDTTLASDNPFRFRKSILKRMFKLIIISDDKIFKMKNYNMILTEKQRKYQHYHQEKLININILRVEKY